MSEDLKDWLTLFSPPGLGPAAYSLLLDRFQTPGRALNTSEPQLCAVPGIGPKTARAIRNSRGTPWADEQIAHAGRTGTRIFTLHDPLYPPLLRQIYAPPPLLFVRGNIRLCAQPTIALVGSRSFTLYGRDTAYRLAAELAARGITIVSGMAVGIDTHAHLGALSCGGATAAVLGSGFDHPYPPENLGLFRDLCDKGAVISEFPPATEPETYHFPRRNRIISGLSSGVVVVEAGLQSGALITARHALEQNRDVFAVPGPIHSGKSTGPNALIKQGAIMVQTVEDILQEIEAPLTPSPAGPLRPTIDGLSEEEQTLLSCLSSDTPQHIDAIAARTGYPAARTLSILLGLELVGLIEQRPGKWFIQK